MVGDFGDLRRHGEDNVKVGHVQEVSLARLEPVLGDLALAFGAMAVAAGIVGDRCVAAVFASGDMTAKGRGAAVFDGRHDLELAEADMALIGLAP